MVVIIDNYDSFTHNLSAYLRDLGAEVEVWRNDEFTLEELEKAAPSGILLSPGPGRPEEAGLLMDVIREHMDKTPMLGICLGHQAIGLHYGGELIEAAPMHGKTCEVEVTEDAIFKGWDDHTVMRYHSLILSSPGEGVNVIAKAPDGEIMGIRNSTGTACGLQFHPESIGTKGGQVLLRNWLDTLN